MITTDDPAGPFFDYEKAISHIRNLESRLADREKELAEAKQQLKNVENHDRLEISRLYDERNAARSMAEKLGEALKKTDQKFGGAIISILSVDGSSITTTVREHLKYGEALSLFEQGKKGKI